MPTLSPEALRKMTRLVKDYHIEFLNDLSREEWPNCHVDLKQAISKLGSTRFETYAIDSQAMSEMPWKLEIKTTAKEIVERAVSCTQRNETTWRMTCEHIIFSRMSAEVACRRCRKRIWRLEIEAKRTGGSTTSSSLRSRQQSRAPCRCPRQERLQDYLEAVGINRIFGHREDETIRLDENISRKLSKDFQKPDMIFGLRQTRNIENLLYDSSKYGVEDPAEAQSRQVHELLPQPLSQTGDPLLFPFLVLESKSGVSGTDWHSIHLQTAFTLRTLIQAQRKLRITGPDMARRPLTPLVWFLCNKGEDWKLSIAFTEEPSSENPRGETFNCKIVDVWRGSITTLDGALQLLLINDYIFDWARDIYREDVIQQLRLLASGENDAATVLYTDTDVFSTASPFDSELPTYEDDKEHRLYFKTFVSSPLSNWFQCRSAIYVENKFCAIVITRDNLQTFLDSYPAATDCEERYKSVVYLAGNHQALMLEGKVINSLEMDWTGHNGRPISPSSASTTFLTFISCAHYFDKNWNIIRELNIMAIEIDSLVRDKLLLGRRRDTFSPPEVSISLAIKHLQVGEPADVLMKAINRTCVVLKPSRVIDLTNDTQKPLGAVRDYGNIRWCIQTIYKTFKKGILEPQDPFIRVSRRVLRQDQLDLGEIECRSKGTPLKYSSFGCLWASGAGPRISDRKPKLCLYFVEDDPTGLGRADLEKYAALTFESQDVYQTIRSDWSVQRHRDFSDGCPWNIKNTYGINIKAFLNFPHLPSGRVPKTQGSINPSAGSGRYMYERIMEPYVDPRETSPVYIEALFIRYKIVVDGLDYWKAVAEGQTKHGVPCCRVCAFVGEDGLCQTCLTVMCDTKREVWFREAVRSMSREASLSGPDRTETSSQYEKYLAEQLKKLNSYPLLGIPFEDIHGLKRQFKDFQHWVRTGRAKQTVKRRRVV